jgi:hypothetical protein
MNVEEMVLKAKQDTQKILKMMNTCFDKKIETLAEWVVVNCIIADVLNLKKELVDEGMIRAFINEFNEKLNLK